MSNINVSTLVVSFQAQMAEFDQQVKMLHGKFDQSFGAMAKSVGTLNTALAGLGVGLAGSEILKQAASMADEYNTLTARLKDATAASGDFSRVQQDLFMLSQKNGVAMKDTVSVFQSMARSAKELGASNAEMIKLTDVVQKLGVIGGSSSEAMKNGLLQFSQALAGGTVHAEEFNSILENMPAVAAQMAKGMGISMGELRTMVKDQKLSAKEMFDALMKGADDVNERFNKMPPTIERAWQALSNQMMQTVGKFDEATGASKATAEAMTAVVKVISDATNAFSKWNDIQGPGDMHLSKLRLGFDILGGSIHNAIVGLEAYGKAILKTFDSGKDHMFPLLDFRAAKDKPDENNLGKIWGDAASEYQKKNVTLTDLVNKQLQEQLALRKKINEAATTGGGAPAGPDEKTLKNQRKHVADILHDRQLETRELELQLSHQDKARAKLEDQIKYIKDSVLTEKEKTDAIFKVTSLYEKELALQKAIKAQKDQAKQLEKSQDFLADLKKQEEALDNQIAGNKELNKHLQNQVKLKELLAEGNKGSKAVAEDYNKAQEAIARIQSKQNTADAIEQTKKLNDLNKDYGKSMDDLLTKEMDQADALERKAQGLEDWSGAIQAKGALHKQTQEALEKQYGILEKINELIAKDPENTNLRAERQKVEESISKTYQDQALAMDMLYEAEERQLAAQRQMKDQKNVLESISKSTAGYADKIRMLDAAYRDGRVNQEQYQSTLQDLYQDGFKKAKQEADAFAKTLTGGLEKALTSGKDFKTVLKDLGKELALLAAKKLIFQPLEQGISNLAMRFFGPRNGVPTNYGQPGYYGGGYGNGYGGGYGTGPTGIANGLPGLSGGSPLTIGKNSGIPLLSWLSGLGNHFDGGVIGAGQWGWVGERGPELAYGGSSGMSIMPRMGNGVMGGWQQPWVQSNVYAGGRGGYSGNGMISQLDNAQMLAGLYRDKYNSGVQAANMGDPNAPNWYTLREIDYYAKRNENIVANGGFTGQMYSRSQFEASSAWAEANEASYMWGGVRNDPRKYLDRSLWNEYDPNQRMHAQSFGLASSGMGQGSSAGYDSGFDLPAGLRYASYSTSQGVPIISTGPGGLITQYSSNGRGGITSSAVNGMSTAFNNLYNGGNFLTAGQQGSYLSPLLAGRSSDWLEAVGRQELRFNGGNINDILGAFNAAQRYRANSSGANGGMGIYPNVFEQLPGYTPRNGSLGGLFSDWRLRGMDVDPNSAGGFVNPNTRFGTGEVYGPFKPITTQLAPDMISGLLSGSGPATVADIAAGQAYMAKHWPNGYRASNSVGLGPQLAPDMISGLRSGSGPATVSDIAAGQAYMARNWPNGYGASNMSPMLSPDMINGAGRNGYEGFWQMMNRQTPYNWMMNAFSGARRMRKGGDVRGGELVITGDGGLEAFVPKDNGKIISNDQLAGMAKNSGGSKNVFQVINNAVGVIEVTEEERNGQTQLILNMVKQSARNGELRDIIKSVGNTVMR